MKKSYYPSEYWENRFSTGGLNLGSVGYSRLGPIFNSWLYRKRFSSLNRLLRKVDIPISDSKLLDVGVGSGAYIKYWQKRGIRNLTGLDITNTSINTLREKFPSFNFIRQDISREDINMLDGQFDIITAFDILFHVVDDNGFQFAISNISKLIKIHGWLLISDSFCDVPWGPKFHEYHRTYEYYKNVLESNHFVIKHIEPIFFTMSTPLCGVKWMVIFSTIMNRVIVKLNNHSFSRWIIHPIGAFLFFIDLLLGHMLSSGPSLKFLVAQKVK